MNCTRALIQGLLLEWILNKEKWEIQLKEKKAYTLGINLSKSDLPLKSNNAAFGEASSWSSAECIAVRSTRGLSSPDECGEEEVAGARDLQFNRTNSLRVGGSRERGSVSWLGSGTGTMSGSDKEFKSHGGSTSKMDGAWYCSGLTSGTGRDWWSGMPDEGLEVQYLMDGLSWAETEIFVPAGGQGLLEFSDSWHPLWVAY